ncbi:hypothetical protein [Streptomyces sp. NPDC002758]
MSTTRRRLGTGPTTTPTAPGESAGRRLLPVERADPGALLDVQERAGVEPPAGRRRQLGDGAR